MHQQQSRSEENGVEASSPGMLDDGARSQRRKATKMDVAGSRSYSKAYVYPDRLCSASFAD